MAPQGKFTVLINSMCSSGPLLDPNKVACLPLSFEGTIPHVAKKVVEAIIECSYDRKQAFSCLRQRQGNVLIESKHEGKLLECKLRTVDRKSQFWQIIEDFLGELGCCENLVTHKQLGKGNCRQCHGGGSGPKARARTMARSDRDDVKPSPGKKRKVLDAAPSVHQYKLRPLSVVIQRLPLATLKPFLQRRNLKLRTHGQNSENISELDHPTSQTTQSKRRLRLTLPGNRSTEVAQPNYSRSPHKILFPGNSTGNLSPPSSPEVSMEGLFTADFTLGNSEGFLDSVLNDSEPVINYNSLASDDFVEDLFETTAKSDDISSACVSSKSRKSTSDEVLSPGKDPLIDLFTVKQPPIPPSPIRRSPATSKSPLPELYDQLPGHCEGSGDSDSTGKTSESKGTSGRRDVESVDSTVSDQHRPNKSSAQNASPVEQNAELAVKLTELQQKNKKLERRTQKLQGVLKMFMKRKGFTSTSQFEDIPSVGSPLNIQLDDEPDDMAGNAPETTTQETADETTTGCNNEAAGHSSREEDIITAKDSCSGATESSSNQLCSPSSDGVCSTSSDQATNTCDQQLNSPSNGVYSTGDKTTGVQPTSTSANTGESIELDVEKGAVNSTSLLSHYGDTETTPDVIARSSTDTLGFNDFGPITGTADIGLSYRQPAPFIIEQHSSVISNINPLTAQAAVMHGMGTGHMTQNQNLAGLWGVNVRQYNGICGTGNTIQMSQGMQRNRLHQLQGQAMQQTRPHGNYTSTNQANNNFLNYQLLQGMIPGTQSYQHRQLPTAYQGALAFPNSPSWLNQHMNIAQQNSAVNSQFNGIAMQRPQANTLQQSDIVSGNSNLVRIQGRPSNVPQQNIAANSQPPGVQTQQTIALGSPAYNQVNQYAVNNHQLNNAPASSGALTASSAFYIPSQTTQQRSYAVPTNHTPVLGQNLQAQLQELTRGNQLQLATANRANNPPSAVLNRANMTTSLQASSHGMVQRSSTSQPQIALAQHNTSTTSPTQFAAPRSNPYGNQNSVNSINPLTTHRGNTFASPVAQSSVYSNMPASTHALTVIGAGNTKLQRAAATSAHTQPSVVYNNLPVTTQPSVVYSNTPVTTQPSAVYSNRPLSTIGAVNTRPQRATVPAQANDFIDLTSQVGNSDQGVCGITSSQDTTQRMVQEVPSTSPNSKTGNGSTTVRPTPQAGTLPMVSRSSGLSYHPAQAPVSQTGPVSSLVSSGGSITGHTPASAGSVSNPALQTPSATQSQLPKLGPVATTRELKACQHNATSSPIPKPRASITVFNNDVVILWDMEMKPNSPTIQLYELYGVQLKQGEVLADDSVWKMVGVMKALPLPMACTLTHLRPGHKNMFIVRAVAEGGTKGPFSDLNGFAS